jgi:hypothetical protein
MKHSVLRAAAAALFMLTATLAMAQLPEYLDIYVVQVKPEKRADFDAISKRIADANRKNGGDTWIAQEAIYGEGNQVLFVSTRANYAEVEKGYESFMGALSKALGAPGAQKMMADFTACTVWSRGQLRRRREDLSANPPKDMASYDKLIGGSRVLRTTVVHVRPGKNIEFEETAKQVKDAWEKNGSVVLASQSIAGVPGTAYYFTMLKPNMGGYDGQKAVQQLLGEEGYQKFLKANVETVESAETVITRFVPEFSNAPTAVAAVAPDFWTPKPIIASAGKTAAKTKQAPKQ